MFVKSRVESRAWGPLIVVHKNQSIEVCLPDPYLQFLIPINPMCFLCRGICATSGTSQKSDLSLLRSSVRWKGPHGVTVSAEWVRSALLPEPI